MNDYKDFFDWWDKEKPYLDTEKRPKDIALDAWDACVNSFPIDICVKQELRELLPKFAQRIFLMFDCKYSEQELIETFQEIVKDYYETQKM